MAVFKGTQPICPNIQHCSEWARQYMSYCLCSMRDGLSLTLGLVSVISWGIAEIPQIITNYKEKSAEGLSILFLITWIIGDFFNLFGCMLEPATLPTQYYMALLYTIITLTLTGQTVYYGHIYPRLKDNRRHHKSTTIEQTGEERKTRRGIIDSGEKQSKNADRANFLSSPIPLPAFSPNSFPGKELYYVSARSLSSSYTPTAGSLLAQRANPASSPIVDSMEEPLLGGTVCTKSAPALNIKSTLCVVSALTLICKLNLHQSASRTLGGVVENKNHGFVIPVGRKLLQVSAEISEGTSWVASFLGWGMAVIYMGGRFPQIWLNIKRGHFEGLNPLMFMFALVGNATYVASILVSSVEWSKVRPNLPWLVDASGCVLLDTLILCQFIYYRYRAPRMSEVKQQYSSTA